MNIMFAGYPLTVTKKVAYELGKLTPNALQNLLTKFISGLPVNILKDAVTKAMLQAQNQCLNPEQFMDLIVKEVTLTNAFKEFLGAALGTNVAGVRR